MGFGLLDEDEVSILKGTQKIKQKKEKVSAHKADLVVKKKPEIKIDYNYIIPEDEKVQLNKKISLNPELYQDFTKELYPYSLNFYDFEVFVHDWFITIINPIELTMRVIVNDLKTLTDYYNKHKNQIWVGYNSRSYDTYIMKGLLLGMNPKKVNDDIILRGLKGWQISRDFKKKKFLDFDIYTKDSLKTKEGFMGSDIRETEVDFNLNRKLTQQEVRKTIKYNIHDVEQTLEVFRRNKYLYESQIQLIETFNLPIEMISLTQPQLTANILECEKQEHNDEFKFKIIDQIHLKKYKSAKEWFENPDNRDYKKSFDLNVCGVPHRFGWGGLHGCPELPLHAKGRIFHVDVTSYYPSQIIKHGFMTRNSKNPGRYKEVFDIRVALKKAGKKKEQQPYKIVLNGAYGMMKDKFSLAYDPKQANAICVNGQLMLLDLLEHLEPYITLIQSNTDGLIIQVEDNEEKINKVMDICHRWEHRTGMGLEQDEITEIFQKDVNNYVFRFKSGKLERKGAYVMELDDLNYDLPIINKALVDYMMNNIPVQETINNCDMIKEFQKIVKVSSNYEGGWHNGENLVDKTFRVFASKDQNDTYLGKYKYQGATIEKFANTPEHCFIMNESVNGVKVSKKLDKRWYIDLALKRLEDFGIKENKNIGGLF
jgi:hypothetical protein